jgi:MFS family permease
LLNVLGSSLTSFDPTGVGVGLAIWIIATAVALYMIPALLVGLLAEGWDRSRVGWAVFAFFLGWPIALAALLIAGRPQPSPSRTPTPRQRLRSASQGANGGGERRTLAVGRAAARRPRPARRSSRMCGDRVDGGGRRRGQGSTRTLIDSRSAIAR